MGNLSKMKFFAVSKESSKFLRPRPIHIVFPNSTYVLPVYILVLFHAFHGGEMTSSVSFAVLAVAIRCCVYGGVASKHRGNLTIAGLCLQRTVDCAAKVEKRFGV